MDLGDIWSPVTKFGKSLADGGRTLTKWTGNPFGIPGFDLNMIRHPTDVGHYAPVTKGAMALGAGVLGGAYLGGGAGPWAGGANSEVGSLAGGTGGTASAPSWMQYARMGQLGSNLLGGGQQQQQMQQPMQPHTQPQAGLLGGYPGYSYQPLTSAPGLLGRQMMMGPNLFGGR